MRKINIIPLLILFSALSSCDASTSTSALATKYVDLGAKVDRVQCGNVEATDNEKVTYIDQFNNSASTFSNNLEVRSNYVGSSGKKGSFILINVSAGDSFYYHEYANKVGDYIYSEIQGSNENSSFAILKKSKYTAAYYYDKKESTLYYSHYKISGYGEVAIPNDSEIPDNLLFDYNASYEFMTYISYGLVDSIHESEEFKALNASSATLSTYQNYTKVNYHTDTGVIRDVTTDAFISGRYKTELIKEFATKNIDNKKVYTSETMYLDNETGALFSLEGESFGLSLNATTIDQTRKINYALTHVRQENISDYYDVFNKSLETAKSIATIQDDTY